MKTISNAVQTDISDVLIRYASGIDQRDWELFRTCFADECDADYGDIGHWYSGDEITAWMDQAHAAVGPSMHRITNVAVVTEGDEVTARSYVHAVVMTLDGSAAIHAYGWYDDVLVSTSDGWRIARRRFTPVTTEMHTPMN